MRPRLISNAPVVDSALTPLEKLKAFAGKIIAVPKEEADRVQAKWEADKKKKGLASS